MFRSVGPGGSKLRGRGFAMQSASALIAEIICGRIRRAAGRAQQFKPRPALAAELHPRWILMLTARTLHRPGSQSWSTPLRSALIDRCCVLNLCCLRVDLRPGGYQNSISDLNPSQPCARSCDYRIFYRGPIQRDYGFEVNEMAPSDALRGGYGHDPRKWKEFRRRYSAELDGKREAWEPILKASRRGHCRAAIQRPRCRAQQRGGAAGLSGSRECESASLK